ncbi:Fis family transcriptional regulator [Vibrio sp. WJH972]
MRKTDKKIENQLRESLTDICDAATRDLNGFQWITHNVNYSNFPQSLKVICVFDTNDNLDDYLQSDQSSTLASLVQAEFNNLSIKVKNINNHISYDTEENCDNQNNGNWANRLG